MASPSSTIIDSGETFRLRNDGDTELELKHGLRTIKIAPKKSGLVPFELIRVWWGDPRSRTGAYTKFSDSVEKGWINKREDEIQRLGVLYGTYASDVATLNDPEWPPGDPRYGREPRRVPHPVSIQTESGDIVVPACFDTSGDAVYSAMRTESEDLNDQVQYREHLEKRLDEIQHELRKVSGQEAGDDAMGSPPGE